MKKMKNILVVTPLLAIILASCTHTEGQKIDDGGITTPTSEVSEITTAEPNKEVDLNAVVENGDQVAVHYTGTHTDGTKFDSSLDRGETLKFTVGAGQMIPGFDAGVVGMKVGDKKSLTLEPKDAYGEASGNTQDVPRSALAAYEENGWEVVVGAQLWANGGVAKIVAIDGDTITIEMPGHPLAGKTLLFDVEMVEITKK